MKPEITDPSPYYKQWANFLRNFCTKEFDFLIKHNVLSGRQLGVLSKRSTVDTITFEALLERKQQHKPFQCTLLDLSKAFDTVDHLLLAKM